MRLYTEIALVQVDMRALEGVYFRHSQRRMRSLIHGQWIDNTAIDLFPNQKINDVETEHSDKPPSSSR